jgi:hypothetical protein
MTAFAGKFRAKYLNKKNFLSKVSVKLFQHFLKIARIFQRDFLAIFFSCNFNPHVKDNKK